MPLGPFRRSAASSQPWPSPWYFAVGRQSSTTLLFNVVFGALGHGHSLPAVSAGQLQLAAEHGLTNRETDILLLLAQGRDAQFVSDALYLSRNTVKSYQKSIYAKLGVHSKQEIIEPGRPLPLEPGPLRRRTVAAIAHPPPLFQTTFSQMGHPTPRGVSLFPA